MKLALSVMTFVNGFRATTLLSPEKFNASPSNEEPNIVIFRMRGPSYPGYPLCNPVWITKVRVLDESLSNTMLTLVPFSTLLKNHSCRIRDYSLHMWYWHVNICYIIKIIQLMFLLYKQVKVVMSTVTYLFVFIVFGLVHSRVFLMEFVVQLQTETRYYLHTRYSFEL